MQSDRNSFCGDVVLNCVNKAFREEDSILDEIYEEQVFSGLYYDDLSFPKSYTKKDINRKTQTQFYEFLVV